MSGSGTDSAGMGRAARLFARKTRLVGIGLVAAGLVVGAAIAGASGGGPPRVVLQPAALASAAAPAGSQSQSWYCTGGTDLAKSLGATTIILVNAGPRRVTGTMQVVDNKGTTGKKAVAIPAGSQVEEQPGSVVAGAWLAARLDVHGGGVTASELVDGPSGSSVAPCTSETSARWYFAQGTTVQGALLFVSLFNPTKNLAVVDLAFHTSSGLISPAPDEGIVIDPGKLVTVTVGRYVQNKPEVATIVSARSGEVTAAELQHYDAAGVAGTALVTGSPAPAKQWELPHLLDVQGGASDLAVLNPSPHASAHVDVGVQLPTGAAAPFHAVIAPSSVWVLQTSAQLRIPTGVEYSLDVRATGVPGVIVGRIGQGTTKTPAPQWGSQTGISAPAAVAASSTRWLVPSVGAAAAAGPAANVLPQDAATATGGVVVFQNPGGVGRRASVHVITAGRSRKAEVVHVAPHGTATVGARVGPLRIETDGPLAIEEAGAPAGAGGVLSLAAVPQRSTP